MGLLFLFSLLVDLGLRLLLRELDLRLLQSSFSFPRPLSLEVFLRSTAVFSPLLWRDFDLLRDLDADLGFRLLDLDEDLPLPRLLFMSLSPELLSLRDFLSLRLSPWALLFFSLSFSLLFSRSGALDTFGILKFVSKDLK